MYLYNHYRRVTLLSLAWVPIRFWLDTNVSAPGAHRDPLGVLKGLEPFVRMVTLFSSGWNLHTIQNSMGAFGTLHPPQPGRRDAGWPCSVAWSWHRARLWPCSKQRPARLWRNGRIGRFFRARLCGCSCLAV
jgi:hypothetical protein